MVNGNGNVKTLEDHNRDSNSEQLVSKIEKLEAQLSDLKKQRSNLSKELKFSDADIINEEKIYKQEMKQHISQLKEYNELKDLSMNLIQLIATQKETTLRDVMNEMGIEDDK